MSTDSLLRLPIQNLREGARQLMLLWTSTFTSVLVRCTRPIVHAAEIKSILPREREGAHQGGATCGVVRVLLEWDLQGQGCAHQSRRGLKHWGHHAKPQRLVTSILELEQLQLWVVCPAAQKIQAALLVVREYDEHKGCLRDIRCGLYLMRPSQTPGERVLRI